MNNVPQRPACFAVVRGSIRLLAGAALLAALCVSASDPSVLTDIVRAGVGLFVR